MSNHFTDLVDLASERIGGRVVAANDEFFAPKENLLKPDKPIFIEDKRFVFFCAAGWRSALAARTASEMGLENVAHVEGGFGAWKQAGGPVEPPKPRS